MMNRIQYLLLPLLLLSCSKDPDTTYPDDTQNKALNAWMKLNRPDLIENVQEEGAYYVEVISAGDESADPIRSHENIWVEYQIECRTLPADGSLQGDIILTRDSMQAKQLGTFTRYTHYVPYFQFAGAPYSESYLQDGIYLSMRNALTLGETYAADKGLARELDLRVGSEVVLYMPASIVSTNNTSVGGGYEGQYTLSVNRPMIARIKVLGQSLNPVGRESEAVDAFATANGGVEPEPGAAGTFSWKIASTNAAQVYYNTTYDPESDATGLFTYLTPYAGSQEKADELDRLINEALLERFESAEPGAVVGSDDNLRIWYIVRFLDGFVVDTNIDEVKEILYGLGQTSGVVASYTPSGNRDTRLGAWYYAFPGHFRFGTYGAIVTPSSNAYGGVGVATIVGGQSAQISYNNEVNATMHPDLAANYYDAFYSRIFGSNDVEPGYFYSSLIYAGSNASPVTSWNDTNLKTEVLPYTPLLVQFYIEPK